MRLTLKMMNPAQAREHYETLVWSRHYRAELQFKHACTAPKAIKARMISMATDALRKADAWAKPQSWQASRAIKLREQYGMGVAAGFLAAHGWDIEDARRVLF